MSTSSPTYAPTNAPSDDIYVRMQGYLIVVFILLFLVCCFVVTGYAGPDFPFHTKISTCLGYFVSFGILLVIPIDIATVVIGRRDNAQSTLSTVTHVLKDTYNALFIISLVLGNFWLCLEEYYNTDGYFTVLSRLWNSTKRFLFDTVIMAIVGLIVMGIFIHYKTFGSGNASAVMGAAQLITNIMYQFFLTLLLSFGLVQFPLSFWRASNLDKWYEMTMLQLSHDVKGINDAQLDASLAVSDVLKTKDALATEKDPALLEAMRVLQSECPEDFRSARQGKVAMSKDGKITVDAMAELRCKLNYHKQIFKMVQSYCAKTRVLAYKIEDIIAARDKNTATVAWSCAGNESSEFQRNWLVTYRSYAWKLVAVLLGILSLLSFIGICCIFPSSTSSFERNSPYFRAINSARHTQGIVVFIWFTFGYTIYCSMYALFQMSFAGLMDLSPQQTTPQALSFNVRMVSRLTAPLAFFYLGWIGENGLRHGHFTHFKGDSSLPEAKSAFFDFYNIATIPAVRKFFAIFFPLCVIIFVVLQITGLFNKAMVFLKLSDYQLGDRIVDDALLREAKKHLQKEKKLTIKKYQRGEIQTGLFSSNRRSDQKLTLFDKFIQVVCCFKTADPGLASQDAIGSGAGAGAGVGEGFNRDSMVPRESKADAFRSSLAGASTMVVKAPNALEGAVEKKDSGTISSKWVEMYCKIQEGGCKIAFFKQKNKPAATTKPDYIYELRLMLSVDKKNADGGYLIVFAVGTDTIKMRLKSEDDQSKWFNSLNEWKKFAADHPNWDVESQQGSGGGHGSSSLASRTSELHDVDIDVDSKYKMPVQKVGGKAGSDNGESYLVSDKPDKLEGWLEKKSESKMGLGSDWSKRYMRIDEKNGTLVYYKTANPGEKAAGTIDLRLVVEISTYSKGGSKEDPSRFNIDMGDKAKVYKWRAPNAGEGTRWAKSLNDWRDYFLLEMK